MDVSSDIVLETRSSNGHRRYVCSSTQVTCQISSSAKNHGFLLTGELEYFSDEYTFKYSGSYFSSLTMFVMLSPMALLVVVPILLADTRIEPAYAFAAFALWFVSVAAIGRQRDVCYDLFYTNSEAVFPVVGRSTEQEQILKFVGTVLERSQKLRGASELGKRYIFPIPPKSPL